MGRKVRTADKQIARIATRDKGVVSRAELLEAGIEEWEVDARVNARSLSPQFAGVYRVGHEAPSTEATYMAAVKACGKEAYLCGRAAGQLLRLLNVRSPPPPEVVARTEKRIKGIRTRRRRNLDRRDSMEFRGI